MPLPGKVPAKESLIVRFGFTPARRRALLGLTGLEKADHAHAAWLQKNVIAPHVDEIIDEFYRQLWKNPQAKNILKRGFELAHLRATQRAYFLTLGSGFDRVAYIESRADVDVFKSINDTYGHLIGDKVLQGITGRLRSAARRDDNVKVICHKLGSERCIEIEWRTSDFRHMAS